MRPGPMLERGATAEQLACEVGMAPVTKESGSMRNVGFRRAVNLKARQEFVVFVNSSRFDNPWAVRLYRAARDRGKRHPTRRGSSAGPGYGRYAC